MKQRVLIGLVAAALLCTTAVFARDDKKAKKEEAKEELSTPVEALRQEKELLIANINNMRNQELRVAILQQLLNEEVNKLRNIQAVFCDAYKLDVEKFRQGLYSYDDTKGTFVLMDNKSANTKR